MLRNGDRVGGYVVGPMIGAGRLSRVYLGRAANVSSRPVIIKAFDFTDSRKRSLVKRAHKSETTVLSAVRHPNIVELYDSSASSDAGYIVMEHVDGQNLNDYVMYDGLMKELDATNVAYHVSSALDHLHNNQAVLHRDIKPANVLFGKDGRVVVIDFDTSLVHEDGMIYGTPGYMAPEIANGRQYEKSDVYSLGWTVHYLLTGMPAQRNDVFREFAREHFQDDVSHTSEEGRKIFTACVEADPELRPKTEELTEQLYKLRQKLSKN